jgi:hypothetical protein
MRKLIVGAVATASIVGGAAGLAVISPLGLAGAQDTPGTTAPAPAPAPGTPNGGHPGKPGMPGRPGAKAHPLEESLKELVADGTITQAQADAIMAKMKSKAGQGHGDMGGRGGFGKMQDFGKTAAEAIGIDVQTLMTELKGGKSLADVARAHNVDPQKVIDALVAKANAEIDKAVADGKLPADKAADAKAKTTERITGMVNGQFPGGHGPKGPKGPRGPKSPDGSDPATPADPAPSTTTPPTTNAPAPAPTTAAPTTAAPTTAAPATTAPPTTAPAAPGTTPR